MAAKRSISSLERCSAKERCMKLARANTCVRAGHKLGSPRRHHASQHVAETRVCSRGGRPQGARHRERVAQRQGNDNNKHVAPP